MLKFINVDTYYPSSDGKPMAENTLQFEHLVKIKLNLEKATKEKDIFVAGDLLWYPQKGNNRLAVAPDVMVAIGRPKGHRMSYLQWKEDNIPPQVVFEILSPSNHAVEMEKKRQFYEKYGVKEYYIYDPHKHTFEMAMRKGKQLTIVTNVSTWTSPLLGIHFEWNGIDLSLFHPNGEVFTSFLKLEEKHTKAIARLRKANQKARKLETIIEIKNQKLQEKDQKLQEKDQKLQEKDSYILKMQEKLRALGIDPDAI